MDTPRSRDVLEATASSRRLPLPELAAMRIPAYRLWWISSVSVLLNQMMTQITLAWLILQMTDSPAWVSFAVFAFGVPSFFLTIPSGVIADRWDRRKLLLVGQSLAFVNASTLAVVVGTGLITRELALVFAVLTGATVALSQPARQSMIPLLVPREHLMNGIVLGNLSQNLSQMTGPMLAGVLIATVSITASFVALACLLVVGIVALLAMRVPSNIDGSAVRPPFAVRDVLGGFSFLRRTKPLLVVALLYLATGIFVGGAVQALVPVLVRDYYHAGSAGLGFAFTVQAISAIIFSLWITRLSSVPNKGALFAMAMMLGSGSVLGYGIAPTYLVALLFFASFGCATSFYSNMSQTILQVHSPPEVLGRVLAIVTLSIQGFIPLGALLAGLIASALDVRIAAIVCGASGFSLALAALTFLPSFRRLA